MSEPLWHYEWNRRTLEIYRNERIMLRIPFEQALAFFHWLCRRENWPRNKSDEE